MQTAKDEASQEQPEQAKAETVENESYSKFFRTLAGAVVVAGAVASLWMAFTGAGDSGEMEDIGGLGEAGA